MVLLGERLKLWFFIVSCIFVMGYFWESKEFNIIELRVRIKSDVKLVVIGIGFLFVVYRYYVSFIVF